jgi:hypothetical protein
MYELNVGYEEEYEDGDGSESGEFVPAYISLAPALSLARKKDHVQVQFRVQAQTNVDIFVHRPIFASL